MTELLASPETPPAPTGTAPMPPEKLITATPDSALPDPEALPAAPPAAPEAHPDLATVPPAELVLKETPLARSLWLPEHGLPSGENRAKTTVRNLAAQTDRDAVLAWLANFKNSPHTFYNARKEVDRLWQWAFECRGKSLSGLFHEDMLLYQTFLANPTPQERWVSRAHFARDHPEWRPFTSRRPGQPPLSKTSQRLALTVLNSMFNWLNEAGYLATNPLAMSRAMWRKQTRTPASTSGLSGAEMDSAGRWLTRDEWIQLGETLAALPTDTPRAADRAHRARWLFVLLYLAGLRISEVSQGSMRQFYSQMENGVERWWLLVKGKGGVVRKVVVSDELLEELGHYRHSLGLPRRPTLNEETPLVAALTGQNRLRTPLSVSSIHKTIKEIFSRAVTDSIAAGHLGLATRLEQASAHWMRHSGASHMLGACVSIVDVRDNLGHASIATTNTYVHGTDRIRHDRINQNHSLGWQDQGKTYLPPEMLTEDE